MREMAQAPDPAAAVRPGTSGRRRFLQLGGILGGAAVAAACGRITTAPGSFGISGSATPSGGVATLLAAGGASSTPQAFLYLTILTGKMIGKSGWPAYVPGNYTLPANSTVQVEIHCFDDGAATVPSGYEQVRGTVGGTMTVISQLLGDLSKAAAQTVQSIAPSNVAHTLTVADIGLNVPVPPLSTVRFLLQTGTAGSHGWQCMADCGTGQTGWGGPMTTDAYMKGTLTVQA